MDCFEIRTLPGRGRTMIAQRNIAANETILEEEPFVSHQFSWNMAYGYLACNHCMRPMETTMENARRLADNPTLEVPLQQYDPTLQWQEQFTMCNRCKVRYCSEDCRMIAYQRYHKSECLAQARQDEAHPINMLNDIWKCLNYPPETGTIMLLVRLMAMYDQSSDQSKFLEQLHSFQSTAVNEEHAIYHKMLGKNFEKQMEALYGAFCSAFQDTKYHMFTSPGGFKLLMTIMGTNSQGVATSVFAEWVKKVSDLAMTDDEKVQLDKIIDDLYDKLAQHAGDFLNNEGTALYLYQSKVNHSCAPNAESTFPYSNDIIVLKAISPIVQGEEICISYLDECQLERSRHSRHKMLKENYLFICDCPKCLLQRDDPDETSADEDDDDDMDMDDNDMEE